MFNANIKLIILTELKLAPQTGLGLINKIQTTLKSRPSPGYIYPLLHSFEKNGFIQKKVAGRKKIYSLTAKGKIFLSSLEKSHEKHLALMEKMCSGHKLPSSLSDLIGTKEKLMQNHIEKMKSNLDYMAKFMKSILMVYEGDYEKNKGRFRKIIQKTTDELNTLSEAK